MMPGLYGSAHNMDARALRADCQYIHRGVLMDLDADLSRRVSLKSDDQMSLTLGEAIEYQVIKDQARARAAYVRDTSNG